MIRKAAIVSFLAVGLLTTACENAADKQKKADQAQIDADQQRIEAKRQADQKSQEAADMLRSEQRDYKAKVDAQVVVLEKQIADLQKTVDSAPAATQAEYRQTLADVTARKNALESDVASIQKATAQNWEPLKTQIDGDLSDLKRSIRTASNDIKATPRGTLPAKKPAATTAPTKPKVDDGAKEDDKMPVYPPPNDNHSIK